MILDDHEYFKTTSTALKTLGGYTSSVSDYMDFGAANANDGHRKRFLNIISIKPLEASGAETITITLVSDSNSGFATVKTTEYSSGAIAKETAFDIKVLLPETMYRYCRIEWTISGTSTDGGTFYAFISNN